MTKSMLLCSLVGLVFIMTNCSNKSVTNLDKIDSLKKQVQADAKTLNDIEAKEYVTLKKDFMACDSMLQYQSPEQMQKSFETLQLVQAYLEQFKFTKPMMQADMDTTLHQLERLKADAESHYLSDSLVTVYLENETEYVNKLSNQVRYFQDRFNSCQQDLNAMKNQK
jgi:hypothetical protein